MHLPQTTSPIAVTFLGTGTSNGVPQIGCHCEVCCSADPHDKRLRSSLLLSKDGFALLLDAGPDLRQQILRAGIERLDAVLFTHSHADHVHGLDDLKRLSNSGLPCFASPACSENLQHRFPYAFDGSPCAVSKPNLRLASVESPWQLGPFRVEPITLWHGDSSVTGYRIDDIAYLTDCNALYESSLPKLTGLKVLIVGALRMTEHSKHFSLPEVIALAEILTPEQTFTTHISHRLGHESASQTLPKGVALAYDGLCLFV